MRSYLGVVLLAGYAVAVPATNQLVIGQETTAGDLDALVGTFDAHQSHKSIETNETIYTYLSQQEEYVPPTRCHALALGTDVFLGIRNSSSLLTLMKNLSPF
jgi:hypothetical protein